VANERSITGILEFDFRGATAEDFARALLDRPIAESEADKNAMSEGDFDPWFGHQAEFVQLCTRLFKSFGDLAAPYSLEEIDQALQLISWDPYMLPGLLAQPEVPIEDAVACIRASYHLFADFASVRAPDDSIGALYMWWDEPWPEEPAFLAAVLETLERVLALPDLTSRQAALHGLAHYKQDYDEHAGKAAIDRFINRERANLSEDLLAYAELCRDQGHA